MDINQVLTTLHTSGQVIELRAIGDGTIASGYFSDLQALNKALSLLDNDPLISDIYITLNEVNPALLARRANRIKLRLSRKDATTSDADIIRRRWLPIDIDPKRPSGVSSTETEHQAAIRMAARISAYLTSLGWPDPLVGDSGNGAHLLYRIDLKNDAPSRTLVQGCLERLDLLFSDDQCLVDPANFNAARIWKLYGTVSRKGDHTPERPHRRSGLITIPAEIKTVSEHLLTSLASLPRDTGEKTPETALSLGDWLSSHDLPARSQPYQGGTLYQFDQCPFSTEHKDGAYAIQFPSGAIFAGCHHTSCGGGTQRWPELKKRYEWNDGIERRQKKQRMDRIRARTGDAGTDDLQPFRSGSDTGTGRPKEDQDGGDPPEDLPGRDGIPGEPLFEEATAILHLDDPVTYMIRTFALDHTGDIPVAECCILSLASRLVTNSTGLHVSITGDSGKGKSHTVTTMLRQIPEKYRVASRISDKALLYIDDMLPGSVITLDDMNLSEPMQELLKGVTTSFKEKYKYRTVTKDRKGYTCTIPERCVWWIVKTEGSGDDQVWNRMLTCWIDDSEEQDGRVLKKTLAEAAQEPDETPLDRKEHLVCHQIWEILSPVWVIIPFAERIRFPNNSNRRNTEMMLDLIKARAAMMQYQRIRRGNGETLCIEATTDDFAWALDLYSRLNGENGSQYAKLTKKENELISKIKTLPSQEFSILDIQRITGWSHSIVYKLIHGYTTRGRAYNGLLEKCPALSYCDRTKQYDEQEGTTYRKTSAYQWDPWAYDQWCTQLVCRLDTDPSDGSDDRNDWNDRDDPSRKGGSLRQNAEGIRTGTNDDSTENCGSLSVHTHLDTQYKSLSSERDDPSAPLSGSLSKELPPPEIPGSEPDDPGQNPDSADNLPDTICGRDPPPRKNPLYGREKRNGSGTGFWRSAKRGRESSPDPGIFPLPGMINITALKPWHSDIGRCTLCDTNKAVWVDPGSRTALCQRCYDKMHLKRPGGAVS